MVTAPKVLPATKPDSLTVATAGNDTLQLPPVEVSASVVVVPAQTAEAPEIAETTGKPDKCNRTAAEFTDEAVVVHVTTNL